MHRFAVLISFLLLGTGLLAADTPDAVYDLHEWGVFTVARNAEWAMSDMRAEWATLPDFFYRVWPEKRLPYYGPVRKPVIYFHAESEGPVRLTIKFAEGRPLVWWPGASKPADGIAEWPRDTLLFNLNLRNVKNDNLRHVQGPRTVDPEHWIEALRKVKSTLITAPAGHSNLGQHFEQEHFVYYDGLMKAPAVPAVKVEADTVVLETHNDFPLLDVMVIDNSGKFPRFAKAWTDKIDAGPQTTRIPLELPAAADRQQAQALQELQTEFIKRLVAAGLNEDEATALDKVWEQGLFKRDGLSVFYRVPQATYDKWLPLSAEPTPRKTVRVGIVFHEHLEPDLETRVEALVAKLAADSFEERHAAREQITKIGGAAFPVLEKHFGDHDAEVARACHEIIAALDAVPALEKKEK